MKIVDRKKVFILSRANKSKPLLTHFIISVSKIIIIVVVVLLQDKRSDKNRIPSFIVHV